MKEKINIEKILIYLGLALLGGNEGYKQFYHTEGGTKDKIAHELSKQTGREIDAEDVPRLIADGIVWKDSLKLFDKALKPMLLKELNTIDVGLKYDNIRQELYYIHTDGKKYYPYLLSGWYAFTNPYGEQEYCK